MIGTGITEAVNTGVADGNRLQSILNCYFITTGTGATGPYVKSSGSNASGYVAWLRKVSTTWYFELCRFDASVQTTLATYTLPANPTVVYKLDLTWDRGSLTAIYNGSVTLTATDATYSTNTYAGLRVLGGNGSIIDCTLIGGTPPAFSVAPVVIGNYGACSTVAFTGVNTSWTSGAPGSPTFTVDHGTLSAQTVATATTATATYCPGSFLGTATFTDPSTGATASATVTSDPTIVPPTGAYQFTPQAVNMVNQTAGEGWLERLLKPTTPIATTAEASLELETALGNITLNTGGTVTPTSLPNAPLLYTVWRLLNGGFDAPAGPQLEPAFSSIDAGLSLVKGQLDAIATPAQWNLAELLYSLGGNPIVSHQDIIDALGSVGGGSNQDVLDAIAAAKGDPLATIKAVLDLVYSIRTTSNFDLADVLSAIAGLPHSDAPSLTPVLNKLTQIQPSALVSLSTILDAMVGANTITNIVNVAIAALAGREGATVSGVLDALNALPTATATGAAVWPGLANVRLGQSHALSDGLTITEPMEGVLITLDSVPSGKPYFTYDDMKAYRHLGSLVFLTDTGAAEQYQLIAFESGVYTCLHMVTAGGVKIRTTLGTVGTVTPWVSGQLIQ